MIKKQNVAISSSRNSRSIVVHRELASGRVATKDRKVCVAIVHRHASGRVLVALNARHERVCVWSETKIYGQLRCRVAEKGIRAMLDEELRPRTIYVNDGTDLLPLSYRATIIVYNRSLFEQLDELCKEKMCETTNVVPEGRVPTYRAVLALDKNISYDDYRSIYLD